MTPTTPLRTIPTGGRFRLSPEADVVHIKTNMESDHSVMTVNTVFGHVNMHSPDEEVIPVDKA